MVILSGTITVSIGLVSGLIFLIFAAVITVFVGFNVIRFKKYEEMTRYKDYSYNSSYKSLHKCLFYCGIIMVPLFKQTIIDARYFIHLKSKENQWNNESMWRMADEDQTERQREKVIFQRGMKLLKLKYSKKNFVIRKIFTIFVSK